ncbi:unnamed protein product [Ambrosiozyma monospora]|uniref:Unnamed protein product n=1 Tax=Ambrosiozyma monospora TaxID=43982 RepID=A0ACB5SXL7_AMBMO|nr:unnamed protein product [Ambrosiozyma monospora]
MKLSTPIISIAFLVNCQNGLAYPVVSSSPADLETGNSSMMVKRAFDQNIGEENAHDFQPADIGHKKPYTTPLEETHKKPYGQPHNKDPSEETISLNEDNSRVASGVIKLEYVLAGGDPDASWDPEDENYDESFYKFVFGDSDYASGGSGSESYGGSGGGYFDTSELYDVFSDADCCN